MPLLNFIYNGTESISFLGPKIWNTIPNETNKMRTVEKFKGDIKYGFRKSSNVDFVNAIWLDSVLSDTCVPGQS